MTSFTKNIIGKMTAKRGYTTMHIFDEVKESSIFALVFKCSYQKAKSSDNLIPISEIGN